jgi:hypothetical protein
MGLPDVVFVVTGLLATVSLSAMATTADAVVSEDQLVRLTDRLLHAGLPGTLTAAAAEKFGLEYQDYPEKYVEISKPDGTHRIIEVVPGPTGAQIFFSQRTGAEIITVRSDPSGEFIVGLQRPNDSDDVEELSGNQGRAFLETEKAYWVIWLTGKRE